MKSKKITRWGVLAICLILMQTFVNTVSAQPLTFKVLNGEWARVDGNYTIKVQNAASDGTAEVGYFNPGNIHVEESNISFRDKHIRLYVKLQDKGYPGSTYTLYYYAEKDLLAGVYYQAATGNKYEVIFERKK